MKKSRGDAKKIGPLKLAALNGLSLSRLPLPDEEKDVPARATNDERVRTGPQAARLLGDGRAAELPSWESAGFSKPFDNLTGVLGTLSSGLQNWGKLIANVLNK